MFENPLKIGALLSLLVCAEIYFVYNLGYDSATEKCKAEAEKVEQVRLKQVKNYEDRLSKLMEEHRENVKRINDYQRRITRLSERVRTNSGYSAKTDSLGGTENRLRECERLLVEGVGVVEQSGQLLPENALNNKTIEELQK